MDTFITLEQIDQAANFIRSFTAHHPQIGIILGSGLGDLADSVERADTIPFSDIPHMPISTVEGHNGQMIIGTLEKQPVIIMRGRIHYYEGYTMGQITFPVRVFQRLGVKILIVTNAAGAINPKFMPGDIMVISDHISLLAMTGPNPLRGPNIDEMGTRFPDMSKAYDHQLITISQKVAQNHGIALQEGVYICLAGPSFETPADLRFLRIIGADAVGMSTVPETIVAHHGGIRVLGFSGISNKANLDGSTETTHEEVLEAGRIIMPKLKTIIQGVLRQIN